MISDILSDASHEIKRYMNTYPNAYKGVVAEVDVLLASMDALQAKLDAPPVYTFHEDGTLPQNGEIFVFGSNLSGIHGGGAAKVAHEKFGAAWGVTSGITGQAYAIPTKDKTVRRSLSLEDVASYVAHFLDVAHRNSDKKFFVTAIGCGLAGFSHAQIAPLFTYAPANCSLPDVWEKYL